MALDFFFCNDLYNQISNGAGWLSCNALKFYTRGAVRIPSATSEILTEGFRNFHRSLQATTAKVHRLDHYRFLPNPFNSSFTDHPAIPTVYNIDTHSLMELSPSWEAANCVATEELPSILWNPQIHYRVHKTPALIPILSQIDPIPTIPSYLLEKSSHSSLHTK
jgi:hypothetical protein